jgi:hypothetical protein
LSPKVERTNTDISTDIAEKLGEGKKVLIYPSGQLRRDLDKEHLMGTSGMYDIANNPKTPQSTKYI